MFKKNCFINGIYRVGFGRSLFQGISRFSHLLTGGSVKAKIAGELKNRHDGGSLYPSQYNKKSPGH